MNPRFLLLFAAGAIFGFGLALSGMTDPGRVVGFLDVAGAWDPALLFVMGGAVSTIGLGVVIWRKLRGNAGWFGTKLPAREEDPIDRRLVLGSLVFGIGWGISGFCPGPAIANLASWRTEALIFVPAMAVGMLLARVGFKADCD
ncbi:MAG TPA: DUF6691 family protein [Opitutaceae bacterium]|nr:DUF6691 family protein [Opitutaceae bacterium]